MEILNFILGLGSTVMLPIIIFVFGLIMRAGFSKSFKSGVTIGIGFTGINLVITRMRKCWRNCPATTTTPLTICWWRRP